MRVIVCGGREFFDKRAMWLELDALLKEHGGVIVIQGGASGADFWASQWAVARCEPCFTFLPDWDRHKRAAGPIRNERIARESGATLCLAFPGGKGTADMVRQCRKFGIEVREPLKSDDSP